MASASGEADREDIDEEILALFEATYPAQPPLSTTEVAEHLDVEEDRVRERLESLKAAGHLRSKSLIGEKKIWWDPEMDFATAELAGSPRQHTAHEE